MTRYFTAANRGRTSRESTKYKTFIEVGSEDVSNAISTNIELAMIAELKE